MTLFTSKSAEISKNNEIIRFDNMALREQTSPYHDVNVYKAFGCLLHWLYVYGNVAIASECTISSGKCHSDKQLWDAWDGKIHLYGKQIAYYRLDDNLQMPVFYFTDSETNWMADQQKTYLIGKVKEKGLCLNCGSPLDFHEIETTQTTDMRSQGMWNPERFNHWGYGCPKSNNRACFNESSSNKDGAISSYYARLIEDLIHLKPE